MLFNYLSLLQKKSFLRTFLRIQWLRFMLPMQGVLVWSLARELRSHMLHSITKKETKRNIFYYQGQRPSINIDTSLSWQELVSWPFLDTGETENCIPWHSTHCLAATLLCGREAESLVENQYSLPHCAALGLFSCVWLCNPMDCRPPSSSVHEMGFSRQEYWSGLPCPPPGDLIDPVRKPITLMSPALVAASLALTSPGKSLPHCMSSFSWVAINRSQFC